MTDIQSMLKKMTDEVISTVYDWKSEFEIKKI
jgi:hypothetical protein